jgi:CBS domain-containing protein
MNIGEVCNRTVVVARRQTPLSEAAHLMREHHVGSLVVVDEDGKGRVPVGIVTDRDLVVAVVAEGADPRRFSVGEVMRPGLVTVGENDTVFDTLRLMRARGIRRVPVRAADGTLAGIVTIDDLLEIVAEQLNDLVRAIATEQSREVLARK